MRIQPVGRLIGPVDMQKHEAMLPGQGQGQLSLGRKIGIRIPCEAGPGMQLHAHGPGPVSYTHLDVYKRQPLYGLESKDELTAFDFVGFTLQYEMSYTNVLNMLDLGKIPIRSKDRGNDMPLIIAGGPCAYNPEPLHEIIDLFVLGEAEEVLPDLLTLYSDCLLYTSRCV